MTIMDMIATHEGLFWGLCLLLLPVYIGLMLLISSCIFVGGLHVISWIYQGLRFVWKWAICWPYKKADHILEVGLRDWDQKRWHNWYEKWSKLPADKR